MGRDVTFPHEGIMSYIEKSKKGTYSDYEVEKYVFDEALGWYGQPGEEFGKRIFVNADGSFKRRRKKLVTREEDKGASENYLHEWRVPIKEGDYMIDVFKCRQPYNFYPKAYNGKLIEPIIEITVSKIIKIEEDNERGFWKWRWKWVTSDVAHVKIQFDKPDGYSSFYDSIDEDKWKQSVPEKLWNGVRKALKTPANPYGNPY